MKKYLLSFGVIVAFVLYLALNNQGSSSTGPLANGASTTAASVGTGSASAAGSGSSGATPAPSSTTAAPSSTTPASSGTFKNGSYTGPVEDAFYGPVQVKAVIQGGALADVKILQEPSDTGHSREVSSIALPMLVQEAIQAQSAKIYIVSGATQTSDAFAQSLAAALTQARS